MCYLKPFSARHFKVWITCHCADKCFMNGSGSRNSASASNLQDIRLLGNSIVLDQSRSSSLILTYFVSAIMLQFRYKTSQKKTIRFNEFFNLGDFSSFRKITFSPRLLDTIHHYMWQVFVFKKIGRRIKNLPSLIYGSTKQYNELRRMLG